MGLCVAAQPKAVTKPYRGKHIVKNLIEIVRFLDYLNDVEITKL